jgi:hypothetical protein
MQPTLKMTIRDNVRRLLGLAEDESGVSRVMALGFSNGTAQRILDSETSIGVDVLEKLADGLKLAPWQLCVPNIEPDRVPRLEPVAFRWPFRQIDPEVITGLVGSPAQQIENGLLVALGTLGISTRRVAGAPPVAGEANVAIVKTAGGTEVRTFKKSPAPQARPVEPAPAASQPSKKSRAPT